jgi:hypothetical protein
MIAASDSRMHAGSTRRIAVMAATALTTLSVAVGCGSGSSPATGAASTPDASQKPALNPDGVPYPSNAGGHMARMGSTPGNMIANYAFQGYLNADVSKGLQTIALADYYDPCGKRSKLLHLTVAGVWCVPCNEETDALVAAKAQLASEGVIVIQALGDGPVQGVAATVTDLDNWIAKHKSNFTEMLDPNLANLGTFFSANSVPFNCDIDPRTMEIIHEGTGWPSSLDAELTPAMNDLPAAPSYPIPNVCGDQ